MTKFKPYLSNQDGNFATMFAVASAMLAVGVAAAIDISGMHKARAELQSHLDGAALAAVIEVARSENDFSSQGLGNTPANRAYKAIILKVLETNGIDMGGVVPSIVMGDGVMTVSATIPYQLQFGGVLNKPAADIHALSQVSLPGGGAPVEIALVLDNTESMNFAGKMTALKTGARNFIEAIEDSGSGSKIALVPFARYVDVGEDKRNEPWLKVPAEFDTDVTWEQATHTGGTCNIETQTRYTDGVEETFDTEVCTGQTTTYETRHDVVESRWIGCVGVRSDGLHMEDDSYDIAPTDKRIPGLLHKWPKEATGLDWHTESWCPDTITPLTNDYDLLNNQIDHLYGTDRTYIPIGLSWGRRILSPEVPFTEADTVNPKRQIMILMSDGNNTAKLDNSINSQDHLTAPPYVRDIFPWEQAEGVIAVQANADTAALCELVKGDGTEMYTIAFQVESTLTRNLLLNCASSPQHHFDAGSNESLVQSFKNISASLKSEIRLMQ